MSRINGAALAGALFDGLTTYCQIERSERLERELRIARIDLAAERDLATNHVMDLASLSWFKLTEEQREELRKIGLLFSKAPEGTKVEVTALLPTRQPRPPEGDDGAPMGPPAEVHPLRKALVN